VGDSGCAALTTAVVCAAPEGGDGERTASRIRAPGRDSTNGL